MDEPFESAIHSGVDVHIDRTQIELIRTLENGEHEQESEMHARGFSFADTREPSAIEKSVLFLPTIRIGSDHYYDSPVSIPRIQPILLA
jgi:hypothetical protein